MIKRNGRNLKKVGIRMNLTHKNRRDRIWNELEVKNLISYYKGKGVSADVVTAVCNLCFHDDDIDEVIMSFAKEKPNFFKRIAG